MMRRGFTIVELIITITIMGILLTLAVVGLNATQANGRDAERKADAEALAIHIEDYYNSDNSNVFFAGENYYLGYGLIDDEALKLHLPDIDLKVTRTPGNDVSAPTNLVAATNNVTTPSGVLPQPSSSNDVYVYQPLNGDGSLCYTYSGGLSGDCRRFNLYYFQETTNSVQKITSKHQ